MANRTLTSARTSKTSLDQERENFERAQTTAIVKAISDVEMPVKAKHVRSIIIGTFQEKGSYTFWSIVFRLPIQSSPIMAWKFCHTLHKLLREGHQKVLQDSQRHRNLLIDTGKLWGHLKEGYGRLIALYCHLLVVKLDFHRKNPRFLGNMAMTDEELELVCENDINNYFQLSVELLDYMDEILILQAAVFGSLDMSRSNSMTNAGQCRLAPLIPCIQDSSHIYDFIVKLLFRLHNCLPPDTLVGHWDRFLKQYKALKQFYVQSGTLQYFKTLIQVPRLEENPPNFLISSELSRHVTPVVIVPEPPPTQAAVEGTLVSLDAESIDGSDRNGSISPDLLVERDRYIEHLLHQMEEMSFETDRMRADFQRQIDSLRQTILDLELRLAEKDSELQEAVQAREEIERKLNEAAQSSQKESLVHLQLQESEKRSKHNEEKFAKLKDVYQKLRDEHIALLRTKAETDKKLTVTSSALEQSNKRNSELQESLEQARQSATETMTELETIRTDQTEKIQVLAQEKETLESARGELQTHLEQFQEKVQALEVQVTELSAQREELLKSRSDQDEKLSAAREALEQSQKMAESLNETLHKSQVRIGELEGELSALKSNLDVQVAKLTQEKEEMQTANQQLGATLESVEKTKENLNEQLEQARLERDQLIEEKSQSEIKLEQTSSKLEDSCRRSLELEERVRQSEAACDHVTADLEDHKRQLREATEKFTGEKSQLDERCRQLQTRIDELEGELSVLKSNLSDQVAKLTQEKEEMRTANQQLAATLYSVEKTKENLNEQLEQVRLERNQLIEDKSQKEIKLEQITLKLEDSCRRGLELEERTRQSEAACDHVTADLEDHKRQLREATEKFTGEKNLSDERNRHLQARISELEQQVAQLQSRLTQSEQEKSHVTSLMEDERSTHQQVLMSRREQTRRLLRQLWIECASKAEHFLNRSVHDLNKAPIATSHALQDQELSTSDTLGRITDFLGLFHRIDQSRGSDEEEASTAAALPHIFPLAQSIHRTLNQAQSVAHSLSNIEKADQILAKCSESGNYSVMLFQNLKNPLLERSILEQQAEQVRISLQSLDSLVSGIVAELKGREQEDVGRALENELVAMERAIEEAARKIAQLWDRSKQSQSGVKLEVNEKILDTCQDLMKAIIILIQKAKILQEEIVARGKGSASAKEFYKRNHSWTEGLLSAAKAVGFGAKLLTDAADKVVQGQAKFEQLTVASQEISASTAQLVFASRVKAERDSKNLLALTEASKGVSIATGSVVAAAKHCAQLVEETNVLDFNNLSLHQAKRLEMESQVRVLELESSLDKERLRLAALRRQHYQLAGESAPDS